MVMHPEFLAESKPGTPEVMQTEVSRRTLGHWAALAAGTAALAPGFEASAAQDATARGGKIAIPRSGDADTLDPHHTTAGLSYQTFRHIYESLVGRDMDLNFEGILAESWEVSEDGLEYIFHLRKGITFTDGTEFNADAVKFSFDRVIDPEIAAPAAGWLSSLKETVVIDPLTVKMTLSEPFSPFLSNISMEYFGIISPTAVETHGEDYGLNPVGTGPWKLKEWVAGERITLEGNPDHQNFHSYVENKGAPLLDSLEFLNMPEEQTQLAAFETGQANYLGVPAREVKRFEESGEYQIFNQPLAGTIAFLEFATEAPAEGELTVTFRPPFDDILLRQAVAYGVNAEEIIETVLEGLATRNFGPMPAGLFAYNPDIEQFGYHYDVDKAKALVAEAGWTDTDGDGVVEKDGAKLEIVLWTWTDSEGERIIQVVQNQLAQIGIAVTLETQEAGSLFANLPESDAYNMVYMIWGWSEADIMYMMTDSNWGVGNYRDKEYRDFVSEARRVIDREERTALYFEASKKMLADAAMVPLWTLIGVTALRPEVKDFKVGPAGVHVFTDAYVED